MSEPSKDRQLLPLEFFRLKAAEAESVVSRANLSRAVDALASFTAGADLTFDCFDKGLLGELVVSLIYHGYTPKTIYNNIIKRLATLYNKAVDEGLALPTDTFRQLKDRLDVYEQAQVTYTAGTGVFGRLQKLIRADYSSVPLLQLGKDILLYGIYCGGLTFGQLAATLKTDYTGSDPAITAIVDRYSRPKNKYLFPLNQSHSTPAQLRRAIQVLVGRVMGIVELPMPIVADYTPVALWAAVALSCGVSASDISACIASAKAPTPVTAFARPSEIGDAEIGRIRESMVTTLSYNPVHWYVMQFRPRVTYDMVRERLAQRGITLLESYYPMEDVARKVGHRKVFESRPVISWLLFFRAHVTELPHLYHEIGDLAWGYRTSRTFGSRYAIISPDEIHRYKTAIGDFGADTPLYPEGTLMLQPGDRLVVLGGFLSGRPATFDSVKTTDPATGRTICRILLDGGHYKDWIVEQDSRLLKKITESEYRQRSTCRVATLQ